jgi:hypothetical protein
MTPEGQKPAQCSTLRNSQERCTHNPLCTKHFHGVLSARPHVYSLQSRYGKVSRAELSSSFFRSLTISLMCRVGREVSHPGPSPDPDKEISTIRLFR